MRFLDMAKKFYTVITGFGGLGLGFRFMVGSKIGPICDRAC